MQRRFILNRVNVKRQNKQQNIPLAVADTVDGIFFINRLLYKIELIIKNEFIHFRRTNVLNLSNFERLRYPDSCHT